MADPVSFDDSSGPKEPVAMADCFVHSAGEDSGDGMITEHSTEAREMGAASFNRPPSDHNMPHMFPPRGQMHMPRMMMNVPPPGPRHFMHRPPDFPPPFGVSPHHNPMPERMNYENQENGNGFDHHPDAMFQSAHCEGMAPDFRPPRFPFRGPPPPFFAGPPGPGFGGPMAPPPPHMAMHHPPPMGMAPPYHFHQHFPPPPVGMAPPPLNPGISGPQSPQFTPRQRQLFDAMQKGDLFVEHRAEDGRFYYYNAKTREALWTKPEGSGAIFTNQMEFDNFQQVLLLKEHVEKQQMQQFPQPMNAAASATAVSSNISESLLSGNVIKPAEVAEWSEHRAPDGRIYYYNSRSMESMWEKPKVVAEWEAKISRLPPSSMPSQIESTQSSHATQETSVSSANLSQSHVSNATSTQQSTNTVVDKTRPVSSSPVSGTPWCVVWTGEGRVFFYNPSLKSSVWEVPDELQGRSDVHKLLTTPPPEVIAILDPGKLKQMQEQKFQSQLAAVNFTVSQQMEADNASNGSEGQDSSEKQSSDAQTKLASDVTPTTENGGSAPVNSITSKMDAEKLAAQQRASMPLEARIKQFKEMLAEKAVSAYSTWEKELHKIVFDPRYLLLLSKERKDVFEDYVRQTVEEERKTKAADLKRRRETFKQLLDSADLNIKSSFTVFSQKYAKDERFRAIEKMRDREDAFRRYLEELKEKEKRNQQSRNDERDGNKRRSDHRDDDDKHRRDSSRRDSHLTRRRSSRSRSRTRSRSKSRDETKVKENFIDLLSSVEIKSKTSWSDARKLIDSSDPRYLAVGSSEKREEIYKEYRKAVKKAKKRKKKEKKEQEREAKRKRRSTDNDHGSRSASPNGVDSHSTKKNGDATTGDASGNGNGDAEAENGEKSAADLDRQRRIEESIRVRERQVRESLSGALRDREAMVERHKKHEAEDLLKALLSDLVRSSESSWHDAKKQLKRDTRWDSAERQLSKDDRKRLFKDHVNSLEAKARELFHKMLDECSVLTLSSKWSEDIKAVVESDPRCQRFSSSDRRCEKEFNAYMTKRVDRAKDDFLLLLKETKLITYKTCATVREDSSNLEELKKLLSNDRRYLDLECLDRERDDILMRYLRDLESKGPPPPPTQSDPSTRRH